MATQWLVKAGANKYVGPFTSRQLHAMIAKRKVLPATLVCRAANGQPTGSWEHVSAITASLPALVAQEPAQPEVGPSGSEAVAAGGSVAPASGGLSKKVLLLVAGGLGLLAIAAICFIWWYAHSLEQKKIAAHIAKQNEQVSELVAEANAELSLHNLGRAKELAEQALQIPDATNLNAARAIITSVKAAQSREAEEKQDEEKRKQDEEKRKLDEEKRKLDEEKSKLDEEKSKLDEEKSKLDEEKSKQQEEKSKQQEEKSKPDEEKSKPDEEKSKPDEEKSKPDEEKSKPDEEKSKPDEEKSEQDEEKSEQDEEKSEPDEEKSEPDEEKSKPDEEKSEPDEEQGPRERDKEANSEDTADEQYQEQVDKLKFAQKTVWSTFEDMLGNLATRVDKEQLRIRVAKKKINKIEDSDERALARQNLEDEVDTKIDTVHATFSAHWRKTEAQLKGPPWKSPLPEYFRQRYRDVVEKQCKRWRAFLSSS